MNNYKGQVGSPMQIEPINKKYKKFLKNERKTMKKLCREIDARRLEEIRLRKERGY